MDSSGCFRKLVTWHKDTFGLKGQKLVRDPWSVKGNFFLHFSEGVIVLLLWYVGHCCQFILWHQPLSMLSHFALRQCFDIT